jgi:hypothetical protein
VRGTIRPLAPDVVTACRRDQRSPTINARKNSRLSRAIFPIEICFGHTASHSASFEQLPNPSASIYRTISATRRVRYSTALTAAGRATSMTEDLTRNAVHPGGTGIPA